MIINKLTGIKKTKEELKSDFNKETENLKKNDSEMKNSTNVLKNALEGINSKLEDAEE